MKRVVRRLNAVLLEADNFILRIVGLLPFHSVRRLFYRVGGMKIGRGSTIHMGARFYNASNISIGKDTIIGEDATLDGRDKLKIGNHVDIASEVMIYNAEHDVHDEKFKAIFAPVEIEDYVFIGPRAIILPGVSLGKGVVVGAGAVVTKSVEPFTIVGGVPAEEIGKRKLADPKYKIGRASWFR